MTCLARQIAYSKHQLTSQSSLGLCFLFEMLSVLFKTTQSSYKYEKHSLVSNFCNTSIFNYHFDEQVLCWNHLWASIQSFKNIARGHVFIIFYSFHKVHTSNTSRHWQQKLVENEAASCFCFRKAIILFKLARWKLMQRLTWEPAICYSPSTIYSQGRWVLSQCFIIHVYWR